METQIIALPSAKSATRRLSRHGFRFSKTQKMHLASLLNDPHLPEMLKLELKTYHSAGNEYFKKSEWDNAVERYSLCIRFGLPFALTRTVAGSEIKCDILLPAASNRTQALLNQRLWQKALISAEEALLFDPKHIKTLFRKAKALEGLQEYRIACPLLEYTLKLSPNNKAVMDALDQCKLLLHQSVTGEYDLPKILCRGGSAPIFSEFVGPIEIKQTASCGRGLFLTEAVEPGRLLLVSNALAFGGSERNDRWEQFASLSEEMIFLCHSSPKFLHQLNHLRGLSADDPTAVDGIPRMELYIPGSNWSPDPNSKVEIPSNDEVWAKCLLNSFDAHRSILPVTFGEGRHEMNQLDAQTEMGVIGVWALPSFFNHSCAPNCSTQTVGKAMFVRAAETMAAGTELTIAYVASYEIDRRSLLSHWKFTCKCKRCLHDEQIKPLIQELLKEAEEGKLTFESPSLPEAFPACCRLISRIEDTIQNLPVKLSDTEKNWIRTSFHKVYLSKFRFEGLLSAQEKIDLLKRLHGAYHSINVSVSGLNLQVAASIYYAIAEQHGKSSVEFQEARKDLETQLTRCLGTLKEEEVEELLKARFSKSNLWYVS